MQIRKQSSFNTNPTTSTPTTSSSSLLDPNSRQLVDSLANRLRRRQCKGSFRTALETLILVRNLLSAIKPAQQPRVDDWVRLVAEAGKRLTAAQPTGKRREGEREGDGERES